MKRKNSGTERNEIHSNTTSQGRIQGGVLGVKTHLSEKNFHFTRVFRQKCAKPPPLGKITSDDQKKNIKSQFRAN